MYFQILQSFKIIVFPHEHHKLVDSQKSFDFSPNEKIDESSGLRFRVLKEAYEGNLIPEYDFTVAASLPLFILPEGSEVAELATFHPMKIKDFYDLLGNNEYEYPFLFVFE